MHEVTTRRNSGNRKSHLGVLRTLVGMSFVIGSASHGAPLKVEAIDHQVRTIYHSPETPGYTSWVGLWRLPDGRLRCDCRQITGPKDKPDSTVPVLESADGGNTWNLLTTVSKHSTADDPGSQGIYAVSSDSCRGMAVLSDGTLVRPVVWPYGDEQGSGYVLRSTDGGKTWGDKIYFLPATEYRAWPTIIRELQDGRLVLFAGVWRRGDAQNGDGAIGFNLTKMMFVSSDKGLSWSDPIVVVPGNEGSCEESDFCELPNGDLYFVHRAQHFPKQMTEISQFASRMGTTPPLSYWYSDRMQSIVQKHGDSFIPEKAESVPLPHAGFPLVLFTHEGIVLYLAENGVYWTADLGKTWSQLNVGGVPYYSKVLQLDDGKIICVGHVGSDDEYGTVDQSIQLHEFRLKVARD